MIFPEKPVPTFRNHALACAGEEENRWRSPSLCWCASRRSANASAGWSRSKPSRSTSHKANSSRCSGPPVAARPRCCACLPGFETPSEGHILLDGEDIVAVPPHRRPVNMMFQSYALFPHLSVAGNIAFGLRQEKIGRPEIAERVAEMLALVRMPGFGRRRVDQ